MKTWKDINNSFKAEVSELHSNMTGCNMSWSAAREIVHSVRTYIEYDSENDNPDENVRAYLKYIESKGFR